jgi:hypothetical protein
VGAQPRPPVLVVSRRAGSVSPLVTSACPTPADGIQSGVYGKGPRRLVQREEEGNGSRTEGIDRATKTNGQSRIPLLQWLTVGPARVGV